MHRFTSSLSGIVALLLSLSFVAHAEPAERRQVSVDATAFNSLTVQTDANNPALAAWGDILKPGMRAIAVSRDLIERGLTHGTRVKIEGLDGTYIVRDKMASRWRNKIDIFMGKNVEAAREWGVKKDIQVTWWEQPEG